MAQTIFSLLLLLSVFCTVGAVGSATHPRSPTRAYIEAQCRTTHYQRLCIESLSNHVNSSAQNPQHVTQVALTAGLAKAQSTRTYVIQVAKEMNKRKAKEYQAVKDCLDQISDSVDQLSQSIQELRRISHDGEENFVWHTSNIQTWLSTAVTDATTCMDGFSGGGKVKATIKAKVLNVAQVCSNALALFNRFAARHRASGATTKP